MRPSWPPVPTHPFSNWRPPLNRTANAAAKTAAGSARRRPAPVASRTATVTMTGIVAAIARTMMASIAADVTRVAIPAIMGMKGGSGSAADGATAVDHSQAIVSWDCIAAPNARQTASAAPSVPRLART